jgi:hypothetical protein
MKKLNISMRNLSLIFEDFGKYYINGWSTLELTNQNQIHSMM